MKTARAWVQEVYYCECPYCGDEMELGTDVFWDEDMECVACDSDFEVVPPGEERG
jgi:hypothetical protein